MKNKQLVLTLFSIFTLSLILRIWNIWPDNILFDFDQYEDLFHTRKILQGDLPLIGRPIYGNPNLHHGVVFFYYNLIPFIIFDWNPVLITLWNIFFNSMIVFVMFIFGKKLFKNTTAGLLSSFCFAISSTLVQFSGWLTSTTITLIFVPIAFLGVWIFCIEKKNWGLYLAAITTSLTIQAEIFFIYLLPIFLLFWLIKLKTIKKPLIIYLKAVLIFLLTIFPLIYTEFKLNFAGINVFLNFSDTFDDGQISFTNRVTYYFDDLVHAISPNIFTTDLSQKVSATLILLFIIIAYVREKKQGIKDGIGFLLLYLFSSAVMLLLGYHRQPWTLIGIFPAVSLLLGFILSRIRSKVVVLIICILLIIGEIDYLRKGLQNGPQKFKAEQTILLSSQLKVMDYTYSQSHGKPFSINSVTYPLYHNALWEYNYKWYGYSKYGYLPTWLGGNQLDMYKVLVNGKQEEITYMIIDTTLRIPKKYIEEGEEWATKHGKVVEKNVIDGFIVYKIAKNE